MTQRTTDLAVDSLPRNEDGFAVTADALSQLEDGMPSALETVVEEATADRLVVVLDGTVETTLAATFAAEAVGPQQVTGLVMPAFISQEASAQTAETIATTLDITHHRVQLHPVLAAFQEAVGASNGQADDLVATMNALDRLQTAVAYHVANTTNALVIGTTNRTDYLLGSFVKHAGTGADYLLFVDLYRTETRALADHLDIPAELRSDPPGHGVFSNPLNEALEPRTIDRILRLLVDEECDQKTVADRTDAGRDTIDRIATWHDQSQYKRNQPVVPTR